MRVLVTGGHGFIGRHLVDRLLAEGVGVSCLNRHPRPPVALADVDVQIVTGDLRRPESLAAAVEGVTDVIHLAGLTRSMTKRAMRSTNVGGTRALYEAAVAAQIPGRFVYCSSQAATGPAPTPQALTEAAATAPALSWYGQSKAEAEAYLLTREPVVPLTILRPPAVYGPGDMDFLTLFGGIHRGFAPILGDPLARYSLVYVTDLADAFVRAVQQNALAAGPFFVAHPEVWTGRDMTHVAESALGRRARHIRLPVSTLRLVGSMADLMSQATGRASLLGKQRMREVAAKHWICSPDAFIRSTGWAPEVGLASGFERTIAWYRAQGHL